MSSPGGVDPYSQPSKHHGDTNEYSTRQVAPNLEEAFRVCKDKEKERGVKSLEEIVRRSERGFNYSAGELGQFIV